MVEVPPPVTPATEPVRGGNRHKARELALQALYQWQLAGHSAHDLIVQFLSHESSTGCDRDYFARLVQGILSDPERLTVAFGRWLDRSESQLDPIERAVLLLGSYELLDCLEVPYRVVINEAVQLAKTFGGTDSHKYVNSILDRVARAGRVTEIQGGL